MRIRPFGVVQTSAPIERHVRREASCFEGGNKTQLVPNTAYKSDLDTISGLSSECVSGREDETGMSSSSFLRSPSLFTPPRGSHPPPPSLRLSVAGARRNGDSARRQCFLLIHSGLVQCTV